MSTSQELSHLLCLAILPLLGKAHVPIPFPDGETEAQGKPDVSHRAGTRTELEGLEMSSIFEENSWDHILSLLELPPDAFGDSLRAQMLPQSQGRLCLSSSLLPTPLLPLPPRNPFVLLPAPAQLAPFQMLP